MMFFTHLLFGIFASVLYFNFFNPNINFLIIVFTIILASIIPDIDNPVSKIGRKFKFVGFIFKHRGFFHSFLAIIIFGYIMFKLTSKELAIAFCFGYASHLIADAMTKKGVKLFHPFSKKALKGFIKTGGFLEWIVFFILIILILIIYF